jgi:hypothetical protein
MVTIRTYQDNGYYFPPTKGSYQAATLQQLIFHIRQAMEDREDVVAVFTDLTALARASGTASLKDTWIALAIPSLITKAMSCYALAPRRNGCGTTSKSLWPDCKALLTRGLRPPSCCIVSKQRGASLSSLKP